MEIKKTGRTGLGNGCGYCALGEHVRITASPYWTFSIRYCIIIVALFNGIFSFSALVLLPSVSPHLCAYLDAAVSLENGFASSSVSEVLASLMFTSELRAGIRLRKANEMLPRTRYRRRREFSRVCLQYYLLTLSR